MMPSCAFVLTVFLFALRVTVTIMPLTVEPVGIANPYPVSESCPLSRDALFVPVAVVPAELMVPVALLVFTHATSPPLVLADPA
jgi:hypothetical protein